MKFVRQSLVDSLIEQAGSSERKRAFHTFHSEDDALNRMLIAGVAGAYVSPHRHAEKFELFTHVLGGVIVVEFDDTGTPTNATDLQRNRYVEIEPMTWHTLVYPTSTWALMEVGLWNERYNPADKEFAPWAPQENDPAAAGYVQDLTAIVLALANKSA